MITFKQHLKEATLPNWNNVVKSNAELKAAVELMTEIDSLEPGKETLLVGGVVRDLLMGKQPKDIDIATNVSIEKLSQHFKTHDIGKSKDFGIVVIPYKGFQFEVAHYRSDVY